MTWNLKSTLNMNYKDDLKYEDDLKNEDDLIWSNLMRTHICLNICHYLLSVVSITEGPKNKIMRKSCLYGLYPSLGSPVKQFLFYRVSRKIAKIVIFEAPIR